MTFTADSIIAMSPEDQQLAFRRFLVILDGFSKELVSVRAQISTKCGPTEHQLLYFYIRETKLKLDNILVIIKAAEMIVNNFCGMNPDQRSALIELVGAPPGLNNSAPNAPATVIPAADAPATILSRQKEFQEAVKDFEELVPRVYRY